MHCTISRTLRDGNENAMAIVRWIAKDQSRRGTFCFFKVGVAVGVKGFNKRGKMQHTQTDYTSARWKNKNTHFSDSSEICGVCVKCACERK